jgi:hypothetical protein
MAGSASAIDAQSFQISPPTANYSGDKGATVQGKIKVTNLTKQPLDIKVGKQNFVAKGEEGEIDLVDYADPLYSLAPWFSFDTTGFTLPGLATKEVGYTIAIPADAEPGGRYGSIVFSTVPPKPAPGQSGASVQQNLAGIVFLRINGPAKEQLEVASFETGHLGAKNAWTPASFFEYWPVDFLTRIKNAGNVHEKATGTITVKNLLGIKVGSAPLDEHFVIPGAVRRLHNSWSTGKQKPFLLGRYTAQIDAKYDGGKTLTATATFWVVPWKQLAIILLILIVIFFIVFRGRKRLAKAGRILAGRE